MIKRISLLLAAALMAVMMMTATAAPAFADPKPCGPGVPGCKVEADTSTNNPNDENYDKGNSKKEGPHFCNPPGASQNTSKC